MSYTRILKCDLIDENGTRTYGHTKLCDLCRMCRVMMWHWALLIRMIHVGFKHYKKSYVDLFLRKNLTKISGLEELRVYSVGVLKRTRRWQGTVTRLGFYWKYTWMCVRSSYLTVELLIVLLYRTILVEKTMSSSCSLL